VGGGGGWGGFGGGGGALGVSGFGFPVFFVFFFWVVFFFFFGGGGGWVLGGVGGGFFFWDPHRFFVFLPQYWTGDRRASLPSSFSSENPSLYLTLEARVPPVQRDD